MILFISCLKPKSDEWTKSDMVNLIKEKSDLSLNENFTVLLDSVEFTPGAFDDDHSYYLIIEYKQSAEKEIVQKITTSVLFDTINSANYADPTWDLINSKTEKGIWTRTKAGFEFLHCDNGRNKPEPFYLSVDTLSNRIELNLTHL